jgi:hypothetical protein
MGRFGPGSGNPRKTKMDFSEHILHLSVSVMGCTYKRKEGRKGLNLKQQLILEAWSLL